MKIVVSVLFLIFLWLQYSFWFGKHGVCDFFRIKNSIKFKIVNDLRIELKSRNDKLIFSISDFMNNESVVVEERARNDLGMIKSDEVFYHIISVGKKS